MRFSLALLASLVFQASIVLAQAAPPTSNILSRVLMVQSRYFRGTTFSIDVDGREYWITAKHILTGAVHPPYGFIESKSELLSILNPGAQGEQWLPVNFSVIDAGNDIDIVILAPSEPLLKNPLPSEPADSAGILLGGDCEFLGFPYGGSWRANYDNGQSFWMPFVKHCTVSALVSGAPKVWILDGINNDGFSGGPVIFHTGAEQKIFAVISGYRLEPTEVVSSAAAKKVPVKKPGATKKPGQLKVNLNSGFIIAYDLASVMDAIRKNPIGPLRTAK
jgi:hypothetical protein